MGHNVVVMDLSLSMPMTGLWGASLSAAVDTIDRLRTSAGDDSLDAVVGFAEIARVVDADLVRDLEWDYTYGSNLAGALDLAAAVLEDTPGRFVVFTDLLPTAHYLPDGTPSFSCPTSPETVEETLKAIGRVAEAGIALEVHQFIPSEPPTHGPAWFDERVRTRAAEATRWAAEMILEVGGSLNQITVATGQS